MAHPYIKHERELPAEQFPGRLRKILWTPCESTTSSISMTTGIAEFPPSAPGKVHSHPHQEEILYVLQGTGQIIFPDASEPVEPGSTVLVPAGTPHRFQNTGTEPLKVLFSFAPPGIPE